MSVVLLHPIGLDHECWKLMTLRARTPDFPGHGRRVLPAGSMTLGSMADEIAETIPGSLDVVGLSMGGVVAQHLALRHPLRIRSLVLACTSAGSRGRRDIILERARIVEEVGMAGVLESTLQRWFTSAALANPNHPGVAYAKARLLADDPAAFAASWRAMADHDVQGQLPGINAPVTVIAGLNDISASVESLRALQTRLPNSRLDILDGPHMLQLERPSEFANAIRRHLQWVMSLEKARVDKSKPAATASSGGRTGSHKKGTNVDPT